MAIIINEISQLLTLFLECKIANTDTRKIEENSMFFCLKGENFDGNTFAKEALTKGSKYVVIDNPEYDFGNQCILVKNVLNALQDLGHHYRSKFQIPVIGITGTNGKTTTKELVLAVLSKKYKTHATSGNFNNHIGVPLTLLSMPEDTEIAIVEMGANHPFEIKELCEIASPNYGIITSIGKAHLEGFGSLEGVIKTKKELYEYITQFGKMVFVSADNELLIELSEKIRRKTYGQSLNADFTGNLCKNEGLLKMVFEDIEIESQLVGDFNFINLMAAIACGRHFGIANFDIKTALEEYSPKNQRSQLIKLGSNTIVMDVYNANPTSMEAALKSLADSSFDSKSVILGDMLELGNVTENEHKNIIEILKKMNLSQCILIGPVFHSLSHNFKSFENSEAALQYLKSNPIKNQYLLIKGSRGIQVEKVLQAF